MQEKSLIKQNILQFIDYKGITKYKFYQKTGITRGILDQNNGMSEENTAKFLAQYPEINPEWLLTGEGEMLKNTETRAKKESKNLIPFYDDVATIGGTSMVADTSGVSQPTDYIDAGDWFSGVTAAIRHYGDSMTEYPNGCILALRQLHDADSIVWGRNYVVETNEIRVTKRLQTCRDDDQSIMAYSTNPETYPDGQLIHEPFKIKKESIRRVFLVLGRVVKEYSSDPVFTLNR
ncbi:MAG: hypothetical protein Q4A00_05765 [Flavobacteriaceae bacterium]|nr:hypothetical protein [Flavobacteriaceae bacterium]